MANGMTNQERTTAFLASFQADSARLSEAFSHPLTPDTVPLLQADLARLKRALVDATDFLPRYDQRQLELQARTLEELLDAQRAAAAPKPRFAFKRRVPATPDANPPSTTIPAARAAVETPISSSTPERLTPSSCISADSDAITLSSLSHRYITLASLPIPTSSTSSYALTLRSLTSCIIDLRPPSSSSPQPQSPRITLSALHATDLTSCILLAPSIRGSALLHSLDACVVGIGAWQVRLHGSGKGTRVFVGRSPAKGEGEGENGEEAERTTPVIEGCERVVFGPGVLDEADASSFVEPLDFSHPNPSVPSPNWMRADVTEVERVRMALAALGQPATTSMEDEKEEVAKAIEGVMRLLG